MGDACPVFTGSVAIARKSGCFQFHHSTAMVKLKTETIGYFEAISARNRLSIAYFGFK
jgi:hypothetical protein